MRQPPVLASCIEIYYFIAAVVKVTDVKVTFTFTRINVIHKEQKFTHLRNDAVMVSLWVFIGVMGIYGCLWVFMALYRCLGVLYLKIKNIAYFLIQTPKKI